MVPFHWFRMLRPKSEQNDQFLDLLLANMIYLDPELFTYAQQLDDNNQDTQDHPSPIRSMNHQQRKKVHTNDTYEALR